MPRSKFRLEANSQFERRPHFCYERPLGAQGLNKRIPKPTDLGVMLMPLVPIDPQIDGRNWYWHCEYLLPICTASVFAWTRCLEPALGGISEETARRS
jgi:hypothetical protein